MRTYSVSDEFTGISSEWSSHRDDSCDGVNLEVIVAQVVCVLDLIADGIEWCLGTK